MHFPSSEQNTPVSNYQQITSLEVSEKGHQIEFSHVAFTTENHQ